MSIPASFYPRIASPGSTEMDLCCCLLDSLWLLPPHAVDHAKSEAGEFVSLLGGGGIMAWRSVLQYWTLIDVVISLLWWGIFWYCFLHTIADKNENQNLVLQGDLLFRVTKGLFTPSAHLSSDLDTGFLKTYVETGARNWDLFVCEHSCWVQILSNSQNGSVRKNEPGVNGL